MGASSHSAAPVGARMLRGHGERTRPPDRSRASSGVRRSSRSSPRRTSPTTPIGAGRSRSSRGRPTMRRSEPRTRTWRSWARRSTTRCPRDREPGSVRGRSGWRPPCGRPTPPGRSSRMSSPTTCLKVVDAGDAPVVPARLERGLRVIHEKVFRVASAGPIPIVLGGDHSVTYPSAAAVARHQHPRKVGIVHFDAHADTGTAQWGNLVRTRHADASPDRRGLGRRRELRPGGPPRLLAREGDVGLDAGARAPLAHHGRDRGPRGRSGDRRRDRRGAGRSRLHLPERGHRRRGSRHGARHGHAGARGDARRASSCERSARSWVRSISWGWTSSRSRRRTTRPR